MDTNLLVIFMTGLLTGGLTCLAVQGGLLASTIAQREEEHLKDKAQHGHALPIFVFLLAKIVAYTLLGLLLGWFGSIFELSLTTRVILQFAVIVFMIGTALNLLNAHPLFRYFVIQPPRFITRRIRQHSKSGDVFAPALLGAFTVFIPCGTTQAMMALAIAAGSPLWGAAIMFAFVLGTSPIFFVLGYLATRLGDVMHRRFMRFAAYAIIILALYNLNGTLVLAGSSVNFTSVAKGAFCSITSCADDGQSFESAAVSREVTINIGQYGYTPRNFSVKAGQPVRINLVNKDAYTCAQAFTIPKLGLQKTVRAGSSGSLEFVAPKKAGKLAFSCSMGMYTGTINVVN